MFKYSVPRVTPSLPLPDPSLLSLPKPNPPWVPFGTHTNPNLSVPEAPLRRRIDCLFSRVERQGPSSVSLVGKNSFILVPVPSFYGSTEVVFFCTLRTYLVLFEGSDCPTPVPCQELDFSLRSWKVP